MSVQARVAPIPERRSRRGRLIAAALLLGVGLGGFFDGIVFHQILQWHHMVSTSNPPDTVANLELNTFFVGCFTRPPGW